MHMASWVVQDWQIGTVLQYQSGQLLTVPNSNNQLTSQLRITPAAGAALNPWNYVPGTPFYRAGFDPNGPFDPRAFNSANPNASSFLSGGVQADGSCLVAPCAWTNPVAGQWGATAPYLEGFRWRRRPNEALNFGRNFRMGKESRYVLNIRAEFQNILNRHFYNAPSTSNPLAAVTTQAYHGQQIPNGGYGAVSTVLAFGANGSSPRTGTIVARFTF
jgi:hypothetical protein